MLFSSPLFLFLFLPVVLTVYYLLPGLRVRNAWLLLASLVFYAWGEPGFVLLLLISTGLNFWFGRRLQAEPEPAQRKQIVAVAVAANLSFLAIFKYAGLFVRSIDLPLAFLGLPRISVPDLALPIGISFFTFHALSYIIDIFQRKRAAARNPMDVALYIFFFPQLVAGPILRWHAIGPQLAEREHRRAVFAEGVRRFVGGLAKKMIIANSAAVPADQIFALSADERSVAVAWLGIVCYTLQIYFDFSGYSDMALGLGKMFGFRFIENFRFPYTAVSIQDFWRRWHISLSTWFRDYVYIPLGGNRVTPARNHLNLVTVFFLCGLWHGASWTFVVWGLYHGLFLVLEKTRWGGGMERMPRFLRHVYALLVVMMGWVLFRADSFHDAAAYFAGLFGAAPVVHAQPFFRYATHEVLWTICLGAAFSMPLWAAMKTLGLRGRKLFPPVLRGGYLAFGRALEMALVMALLLISAAWLAAGTYNPFIYFRF
jgi:alginate O-acetyltransferase complex protein AlgI